MVRQLFSVFTHLTKSRLVQLEQVLIKCLQILLKQGKHKLTHPFVFSIAVAGQLNKSNW